MSQPASQTVTVGQPATFSVVVSGSVPLAYQWTMNGASISGATEPTYTTAPATAADSGEQLAIVVSNMAGSVTSAPAMLIVIDPSKITPTITWASPADIFYGTPLGPSQLNATAGVPGTLVYTPAAGTVLSAGVQTLHVEFTPTDAANFNPESKYVQISVSKATPTITWADPADIAYGTPVGAAQLNATASVAGTFVYTPAADTVLSAGVQTLHVEFSPADAANFNSASKDVQLGVLKAAPTITWANPADIAYGTPLGAAQLNATTSVAGTFVYIPAAGTVLSAGVQTLHMEFSPVDAANFSPASKDVQINVGKITPTITWADPADIAYGTPVGAAQLNATASVAGTFVYTPAADTVLSAGVQTLHVEFTPSDAMNFDAASKDVQISVVAVLLSIAVTPDKAFVDLGGSVQFTAIGTYSDDSTQDMTNLVAWSSENTAIATMAPAGLASGLATGGPVTLTATYNGIAGTASLSVGKPVITSHPMSQVVTLENTVTFTVAATGPGPLSYQWQRNGVSIFGATSSIYSTVTSEADHGAEFAVIVSNEAGSVASNPGIVSLIFPAAIVTYPENQTVAVGETATFSVEARGTYALSYQWRKRLFGNADLADIPGATLPTYVTPPAIAADQRAEFAVRVSDTQGNVALASAVLTVTPTSPAIYYIDYLTGDDNNDGTASSAPWRHAPGMSPCGGLCLATVLHPGDRIVFKGGVTWDRQAFPMSITRSGTGGDPIYYGVDKSWFAGSAWTRPTFDLSGAVFADSPVRVSFANFVTVDGIEMWNARVDAANQWSPRGNITVEGGSNVTIQNCYLHEWSVVNAVPGSVTNGGIAFFGDANDGTVENCTLDGSPAGDTVTGVYGGRIIRNNIIQNVPNAIVIQQDQEDVEISGNRIFNIRHSADLTQSENGIVVWGPARIHNNVIHDLVAGATAVNLQSFSFETDINQYVYNNLIWNIGSKAAVTIGPVVGIGSNQFIFNNTIQAGATACVQVVPGPFVDDTLTVKNNHCISDETSLPAWCWNWSGAGGDPNCGPVGTTAIAPDTANIRMSISAAIAQGYTAAGSFRPSSPSGGTVGAGQNLSSACASAGAALCEDRLAIARPGGAATWDAGAYFHQAAADDQAPSITQEPASRIVVAGQTATFAVVATGTPTLNYQWQQNGVDIAGANSAGYTTPAASLLDDGARFTVVVTNASGNATSGIAILSVRDVPGMLTSSASTVNFGDVFVGISSQADLTLTNSGQLDVAITSVSVAGPGFQVGGVPAGMILAPGRTATLRITFSPATTGSVSGSMTVASDAADSPLAVSLSGTGVALVSHGVILSWAPSTSDLTGYRLYRRTASPAAYVPLTANVQFTTNYADISVSAGETYFYVVTAVGADNLESEYSDELSATIPIP